jgi:hypothetical protein
MTSVLRVVARPQSEAATVYRRAIGRPEAIAPGIAPHPEFDLVNHGGKTIASLTFVNFYLSGAAWPSDDRKSIDAALEAAMADSGLNNVMAQYFDGVPPPSTAMPSQSVSLVAPPTTDNAAVQSIVAQLANGSFLDGLDLNRSVVNLMLPPGIVLADTGGADSLHGLGGYHGSVHARGASVYYAVGAYSQVLADGRQNGIVAFDQPWKNVVATFCHELNEVRTDANVDDAISTGNDALLGWTSSQGYEVGDEPVFEASGDLTLVFQEVQLADGSGTVPVQLMWSNTVHGPEGPVDTPEVPAT